MNPSDARHRTRDVRDLTPGDAAALDLLCINTLRTLSIDQVQKANSGHPGTPMGAAPTAYTRWQRFLLSDPADPGWPDRDRCVLSVGHASALRPSIMSPSPASA